MLLRVENLSTQFSTYEGALMVVDGVSLVVPRGRTVALVGESGSGKSVTSLSIMRLLPPGGKITSGRVEFDGADVLSLSESAMRSIRGNRIAMIFQEPMSCLNPVLTVGEQIAEPLRTHRGLRRRDARGQAIALLRRVGIPSPDVRVDDYPHQISGGMRQRVMIAMALACEPALLIADEPTTSLDVTVQAQILELLREIRERTGMAMLFITHDLAVVAQIADEIAVMYAGRIVEKAPVAELLREPKHPYTRALLRCLPDADRTTFHDKRRRLPVIGGDVPSPSRRPDGCAFHPRCDAAPDDRCRTSTPPLDAQAGRSCACWKTDIRANGHFAAAH